MSDRRTCPRCGSTDTATERRMNGNSECAACSYAGPTINWPTSDVTVTPHASMPTPDAPAPQGDDLLDAVAKAAGIFSQAHWNNVFDNGREEDLSRDALRVLRVAIAKRDATTQRGDPECVAELSKVARTHRLVHVPNTNYSLSPRELLDHIDALTTQLSQLTARLAAAEADAKRLDNALADILRLRGYFPTAICTMEPDAQGEFVSRLDVYRIVKAATALHRAAPATGGA